jgi:hypothetical protein
MVVKARALTRDGRAIEIRIRANRRVAIRAADLPQPPPGRLELRCMGEALELRYVAAQFGFAVYYVPAGHYRRLLELAARYEALPCVLWA